jgi:flagellar hook-associated protein 1 FlgK
MMNQFSSLELGKRALDYFRRGMETSGHNIANADVEGYSRQRVEASTTEPFTTPGMSRPWVYGQIGTGVKVDAIVRMRDAFLDAQFDEESTVLGYWDQIQQVLRTSELYVNEPNGTGFEVSVNEF